MALVHQNYKAGNYKHALEHSSAVYERNPHRSDNLLLLGAIHYQKRAMEAEQKTETAHRQIDKLKRKQEHEISNLNELLTESHLPKEVIQHTSDNVNIVKHNAGEFHDANNTDQQWWQVFEPFYNGEDGDLSKLAENSSWFSGYDRCNI